MTYSSPKQISWVLLGFLGNNRVIHACDNLTAGSDDTEQFTSKECSDCTLWRL